MGPIYILWLRELKRYVRSRAQIVASLGQPLLYLLALGFGLGPVFQKSGNGSYLQFVAPGVIGKTLGGVTVALIQGTLVVVVCLLAGFRPTSLAAVPLAFCYMALIALV